MRAGKLAPRTVPSLVEQDTRTPEERLDIVESKGREVAEAVATPRKLTRRPGGGYEGP